ncbi:hypothetical protein C5B90_13110 [Haloferax sp. Atlit-12N]|jgi:uncharacterized membrane protein YraQ (UPF0718 family)|uniref:hypothetical protein n=1 Tax=Haloferax sp. Atlit-12N TaxID=2077203 RepID=UPI000E23226E|nr:hypothetical protein [Haloferax sp. Atlit-12N]RDZ64035.1 hypothetical protein C5B90_13110 [Haloferax sp. Atlit-12N]
MQLPSWTLSGIIALLLGLYVANQIRGQDHGADQPQHPNSGEFITEDNDFWRWLLSGLGVAAITAYLVPRATPAVNSTLQNISPMMMVAIGIWGLVFLREAFDRLD